MTKFDIVYVYTTDIKENFNRVKIGKTTRFSDTPENAAMIRIKEQFTAGNRDEKINLIHVFDQTELDRTAYQVESALHKILKVRNVGGEWFDIENNKVMDMSIVYSAYNEYMKGIARPNSFSPRINQQLFIDKAFNFYNDGGKDFLLAAIMRYGKTISAYWLAKKMNMKNILILSAKTDVKYAWQEDLLTHTDFEGWEWYDSSESSKTNSLTVNKEDKHRVIFLTLQDSKEYKKNKLENVINIKYDLVIVDETHFATETEKADNLFSKLNYKHRLDMSGTSFKKLMSGQYDNNNTYQYGLIEEVRDINKGYFSFNDLPKLNLYTVNIQNELISELDDFYNEDEGFKFSTLFVTKQNGEFEHKNAVFKFLDILASENPRSNNGVSPYSLNNLSGKLDHTLWFLPKSIASVKALVKLLKKHVFFSSCEIFTASGDNDGMTNEVILDKVRYNSEVKNKKTIVVSAGKFSTGVSMRKWNTVFMMNDSEDSPEEYYQSIFRSKTPDSKNNKNECFAIDFNPDRALVMQYKYAQIQAIYEDKESTKVLKEFNDVLPIMNCSKNTLIKTNINDIFEAMGRDMESLKTWSKAYMININMDTISDEMASLLDKLDPVEFDKITSTVSKNGVNKGKKEKSPDKEKNENENKNTLQQLKEKALSVVETIPTFLEIQDSPVKSVKSLISSIINQTEVFKLVTGVENTLFRNMINCGIINTRLLNIAIEEYNLINGDV